jgi:hypothetical protein
MKRQQAVLIKEQVSILFSLHICRVPVGPHKIICSSKLFHGSFLKIEIKFMKF